MTDQEQKLQEFEAILAHLKTTLHLTDEVMIRLNNKFFDSVALTLGQLKEAIETADYDLIERLSHSIKGGASSLQYIVISEIATRLEEKAQKKEDYSYQATLNELIEEFNTAQECYRLWKAKKGHI